MLTKLCEIYYENTNEDISDILLQRGHLCKKLFFLVFFNFMLYQHETGSLVLRYSVSHFPSNSGDIACPVAELTTTTTPRFTSTLVTKKKVLNILIPRIGIKPTTTFTVTRLWPCATTYCQQ